MSGSSVCWQLVLAVLIDGTHFYNQEYTKQIEKLNKQIIKQNDQITQQHLQLQQLNIIINVLLNNNGKVSRQNYTIILLVAHLSTVQRSL